MEMARFAGVAEARAQEAALRRVDPIAAVRHTAALRDSERHGVAGVALA
jgi:hypothetical protein